MSFRIEEKLYIKEENLFELKNFLIKKKSKKPYESRLIRSTYFDNHKFDIYRDSIEGLTPRKKIRIRHYPNNKDSNFYLETKNSSVEGRFKKRKIIQIEKYTEMKKHGIYDSQYGLCMPVVDVEYKRDYLIINDVRFSIDTNIKYFNHLSTKQFNESKIIVELKCEFKKNQDILAKEFPFQKIRFSKYCNAVEFLNLT